LAGDVLREPLPSTLKNYAPALASSINLSGPWKESQERRVQLLKDNYHVVMLYVEATHVAQWFAAKSVISPRNAKWEVREMTLYLLNLYVFADKVIDIRAKNTFISEIAGVTLVALSKAFESEKIPSLSVKFDGLEEPVRVWQEITSTVSWILP
jgi:hypothetical protein